MARRLSWIVERSLCALSALALVGAIAAGGAKDVRAAYGERDTAFTLRSWTAELQAESSCDGRPSCRGALGASEVLARNDLEQRVVERLRSDKRFRDVGVEVHGDTVTLFGVVVDSEQQRQLERLVRSVSGVRAVIDNTKTRQSLWQQRAQYLNQVLRSNNLGSVSANIVGDTVYLSGSVYTPADKERAINLVKDAMIQLGVLRPHIEDTVAINPSEHFILH